MTSISTTETRSESKDLTRKIREMREEVPFDAVPLFTFQKDDDFCKYGFGGVRFFVRLTSAKEEIIASLQKVAEGIAE